MIRAPLRDRGFGSTLLSILKMQLAPALPSGSQRPGTPPGVLEMDDSTFWYRCSPNQGFECYFRPIRSCAQASGRVLPTCEADEIPDWRTYSAETGSPDWLQRHREALRVIWQYNEQTAAYLDSAAAAARNGAASPISPAAPHISVHIRRGDGGADGRKVMSMHTMAARVKHLVAMHQLQLKQVRVHVMSDDANVASRFFGLLHLKESARVAVPALPTELASGFQTCLSPTRWGWGVCNCSRPVPKNTSRKMDDLAWRLRCLAAGTENVFQAPYTWEQLRTLMHSLLLDLELARKARLFLGPCTSNVGHLVQLLRDQDPMTALCLDDQDNLDTVEPFSGDPNCWPCRADWPPPYFPDWSGHMSCPNTTKCLMRTRLADGPAARGLTPMKGQ